MVKLDYLTLQQRLMVWLLLPIITVASLGVYAAYLAVLHFTNIAYDRALEDTVRTLARQIQVERDAIHVNLPEEARQMLEFDQVDRVYFSVSDQQETLLVSNAGLLPSSNRAHALRSAHFYRATFDGHPVRIVEYDMAGLGKELLFIRVAETMNKREIAAREALIYMLIPQFFFLFFTVLLVWFGSGYAIAPLTRVREAIARRTHEDLTPLNPAGLPLEVSEQVRVINALMARLGRTIDGQRRFIADATHQLRTPIAVLQTQIELALRAQNFDEVHAAVERMGATTTRLGRLANQLLNLSRAEAGSEGSIEFSRIDLGELIEDVVAGLVPYGLAKDVEIFVDVAQHLPRVLGDRRLLADMLANLVDNAIRYTQSKGRVHISGERSGDKVIVIVSDNGPGIPQSEMDRVMERFYRGEHASSEGSGLGLAIAHEIAALHKGRIDLSQSADAPGLHVTVMIPASA
ncbi:sensor histidine kinase [uncultured Propionivibrio sp.]|uniref:sensor histidine kinase n=1 Tax=uncultured Propionivibrio sp. TaxID=426737 RepID=UPI0029C0C649|nr:sensor histidine kinase [uncultured Propionivibrio sp.]